MAQEYIAIPLSAQQVTDDYIKSGAIVIYIGINGKFSGIIALADVLRSTARELVTELKSLGVHPILSTRDNEATAGTLLLRLV